MHRHRTAPDHNVEEYLQALKASARFGPQVVCHQIFDRLEAVYSHSSDALSPLLSARLQELGVKNLYSHQSVALARIAAGDNIMVATPTSSGKSMIYNLPVIESALQAAGSHALYLFPLKALSQDQLRSLTHFTSALAGIDTTCPQGIAAIYDGDTTAYGRRRIREKTPPVVITNPDMLHLSFLPFHENWAHFFSRLDYVVIDEVHTYRGVFGSHVAWLLRRLKRVLSHYGKKTRFILSSATIGNPGEFGEKLIGEPLKVITSSGAPRSKRNFLFLNPWDSPAYTAGQLLEAALKRGLRTIVYTQSRKMTELISMWTRPRLGPLAAKLSSYRAGFLPEERRDIEQKLADGSLLGVISTSALELGIDIGDLDICILVGYPGSIMASWQRGGRVGRGDRESAVILIGSEDALDQYYMNNPQRFFSSQVESAALNPDNAKIVGQHLQCAAAEIPIDSGEALWQNEAVRQSAELLSKSGRLLLSADGGKYFAARKRPQRHVSLRGTGRSLSIINAETGQILGEIDAARALKECHEGALYLHRVESWLVRKLDLFAGEVIVESATTSYYTRAAATKDTEILSTYDRRLLFGCRLSYGQLKVSEQVTAYQKRNKGTNKLVATIPLDLPLQTMETEGFWLEIPDVIVKKLEDKRLHFMGGLHAAEHIMIAMLPLLVLCDRNDVGGISCPHHEQTEGAAIFIYDGHAGGSGLSAEAYAQAEELVRRALEIVSSCDCENGCPSCVHSPKCGSGNRPIDKNSCIELMSRICDEGKGAVVQEKAGEDRLSGTPQPGWRRRPDTADIEEGRGVLPERFGVFDLETKFSADEVGGWHRAERMGVSVGVVYDSTLDGCVSYREQEVEALIDHLHSLELVVGFNNKRFDNRVLGAYTGRRLDDLPSLDLLEEVKKYLGYRLSLNALAENTLGIKKSGSGLQALEWYRQGRIDLLCSYCTKDVEITRDLLLFGLENGYMLFTNKAGCKVRLPLSMAGAIAMILNR